MFCSKCGVEIKGAAKFCSKCGEPVKAITKEVIVKEKPIVTQTTAPKQSPQGIMHCFG